MCECYICHKAIVGTVHEDHGYNLCEECYFEDKYSFCHNCNKLVMDGDVYNYNGNNYCENCMVTCEDCDEIVPCTDSYILHWDRVICENCYEDSYFTCSSCGDIEHLDECSEFEHSDYCSYCYEKILSENGIHEYGYKPSCEFYHTEDESQLRENNLHVGIELEIQGDNRLNFCSDITDKYDYDDGMFYLKVDGSLENNGIELISQPMTLDFICNSNHWKYCFDKMKENNMNDICGCGLHFHLDRNYLTQNNIVMIDYIVNNFSDFFAELGGRSFNYYCQKRNKNVSEWGRDIFNRYSSVNLTNINTVELRFCASTDDYQTFIRRVQIIFAIVEFAQKYSLDNMLDCSVASFKRKFKYLFKKKFGYSLNKKFD